MSSTGLYTMFIQWFSGLCVLLLALGTIIYSVTINRSPSRALSLQLKEDSFEYDWELPYQWHPTYSAHVCLLPPCARNIHPEQQLLTAALAMVPGNPFFRQLHTAGYSRVGSTVEVLLGYRDVATEHQRLLTVQLASNKPHVTRVRRINAAETVHIVISLHQRVKQLKVFLQHLVEQVFPRDNNFVLHVAYTDIEHAQKTRRNSTRAKETKYHRSVHSYKGFNKTTTISDIERIVQETLRNTPNFRWTWQEYPSCSVSDAGFSRGCLLNAALSGLQAQDLVLLCDVDMILQQQALTRCRANTRNGTQAYFPIVFSKYNPNGPFSLNTLQNDNQHKDFELKNPTRKHWVSKNKAKNAATKVDSSEVAKKSLVRASQPNTLGQSANDELSNGDDGFWRGFGYGMACVYQADAMRVGGFPEISGWGGEDLAFFRKLVNLPDMEVVRGSEPGLVHMNHGKRCRDWPTLWRDGLWVWLQEQLWPIISSCYQSKVLTEGSQVSMAHALIKLYNL